MSMDTTHDRPTTPLENMERYAGTGGQPVRGEISHGEGGCGGAHNGEGLGAHDYSVMKR